MDVGTNKTRKDTRAVVSLVARYRSPSTFEYVEEACCDVSLGGMFIRSKDPASAGTLLKLECESGVGEQIRGVARVVWLRTQPNEYGPSGMGVKFVKLDPESRDLITRIVQELAAAGVESPSMSAAPENRGKPPAERTASSTPAAAVPTQPKAAEISATRPLTSSPPRHERNDVAVLQRASGRATPPPAPISSKPPGLPGVSSRPAPSNALLARTNVEPIEVAPEPSLSVSTPPEESVRDLAPLQAMVRSSRVSSAPPPEERSGRAFWLVAGAVVALGAIVALFSMRAVREAEPADPQANAGATPALQSPVPSSMTQADPVPSEPVPSEGTPAQLGAAGATQQAEQAQARADLLADPAQIAPTEPAVPPTDVAQAPVAAAPEANGQTAQAAQLGQPPAADSEASAASAPANARPSTPASTTNPQATAAATPTPARPALPEVPVLRIVPADPAPTDKPEAAPTQQPTTAPPSAASASPTLTAQPSPVQDSAATSSTTPTTNAEASGKKIAPPPLPPGEIARVIMFTSRPIGATVFVGDQSLVTPGELNLGAMPPRIRVTAQKEGFESSTVWINNVAEFQKVSGVMRREVHFVLRALPAGAVAPGQPSPTRTSPSTPAPLQSAAPGGSSPAAPTQVTSRP